MTNNDSHSGSGSGGVPVVDLLGDRIDGHIESVVWHNQTGRTYYGLVVATRPEDSTVALTTVVLDLADETLRVHADNSMWLPGNQATLDGAIRSLARATNHVSGSIDDGGEPMLESLVDRDVPDLHSIHLDDEYSPSSENWQADQGVEERYAVHDRLEESPIQNSDRFIMLEFGGKAPWKGQSERTMFPPEEIGGNYGVEVDEDDDLVILDIDYPEEAPLEEIPTTLTSRSPHGGEHYYLHCPGWRDHFKSRFDALNPHPSYGEIRSQDGYVVGPGCELTECKHGCCTEDDPGRYELVDAPIETIQPDALGDLIEPYRGGDGND